MFSFKSKKSSEHFTNASNEAFAAASSAKNAICNIGSSALKAAPLLGGAYLSYKLFDVSIGCLVAATKGNVLINYLSFTSMSTLGTTILKSSVLYVEETVTDAVNGGIDVIETVTHLGKGTAQLANAVYEEIKENLFTSSNNKSTDASYSHIDLSIENLDGFIELSMSGESAASAA